MSVYVRGWAWCLRTEGKVNHVVDVFRYAAKPQQDHAGYWAQGTPDGEEEVGAVLCAEGFFAATGLGPRDLPPETPVKVRFGNAEVID